MRLKLLLLFALGLPTSSHMAAEQRPDVRTLGQVNGYWWGSSSEADKSAYFLGLMDGWHERGRTESVIKGATIRAMDTDGMTLERAVTLIDHGYSDPANSDLPIGWVFMAEVSIKRGDTSADSAFTALRHLLNKARTEGKEKVIFVEPVEALRAVSKP